MPIPNDPLQPLQWYIDRSVRQDASVDLNVLPVWADYSGAGVHVGIFDELIESAHPDLVENYDSSLEIAGLTYDVSSGNGHGTAVAGIIGASANGDGVAGIAYDASITSAPVIYNTSVSFSAFVTAMSAADRFDDSTAVRSHRRSGFRSQPATSRLRRRAATVSERFSWRRPETTEPMPPTPA